MTKVVSQVHTIIDVLTVLTQALNQKDTSQLDALKRRVGDWIMLDSEKQAIIDLINATEEMITEREHLAWSL